MNKKLIIKIVEKEDYLRDLYLKEKDLRVKERLHFIYLLKSLDNPKLVDLSKLLAKDRGTLRYWLNKYNYGGLKELINRNTSQGRPNVINNDNLLKLKDKLSEPEGFKSYDEIRIWLKKELNIEITYADIFRTCNKVLKASPKVPRPKNSKQNKDLVEDFKKKTLKKK